MLRPYSTPRGTSTLKFSGWSNRACGVLRIRPNGIGLRQRAHPLIVSYTRRVLSVLPAATMRRNEAGDERSVDAWVRLTLLAQRVSRCSTGGLAIQPIVRDLWHFIEDPQNGGRSYCLFATASVPSNYSYWRSHRRSIAIAILCRHCGRRSRSRAVLPDTGRIWQAADASGIRERHAVHRN